MWPMLKWCPDTRDMIPDENRSSMSMEETAQILENITDEPFYAS